MEDDGWGQMIIKLLPCLRWFWGGKHVPMVCRRALRVVSSRAKQLSLCPSGIRGQFNTGMELAQLCLNPEILHAFCVLP